MTVVLADDDTIVAVKLVVPEENGWLPWFDQPEGKPQPHPELGEVYSQRIRLVTAE
ncbi:MAG: hypothetical protein ABR596_09575 [Halarsenatibacteraceae bacterium]